MLRAKSISALSLSSLFFHSFCKRIHESRTPKSSQNPHQSVELCLNEAWQEMRETEEKQMYYLMKRKIYHLLPVAWQQDTVASEPGCRALPYFDTVLAFWRDVMARHRAVQVRYSEPLQRSDGVLLSDAWVQPPSTHNCWITVPSQFFCVVCMFSLHILTEESEFGQNLLLCFKWA